MGKTINQRVFVPLEPEKKTMNSLNFSEKCANMGINDYKEYVCELYVDGMSYAEISRLFVEIHEISVSAMHLRNIVSEKGLSRSRSSARLNAVKNKRENRSGFDWCGEKSWKELSDEELEDVLKFKLRAGELSDSEFSAAIADKESFRREKSS